MPIIISIASFLDSKHCSLSFSSSSSIASHSSYSSWSSIFLITLSHRFRYPPLSYFCPSFLHLWFWSFFLATLCLFYLTALVCFLFLSLLCFLFSYAITSCIAYWFVLDYLDLLLSFSAFFNHLYFSLSKFNLSFMPLISSLSRMSISSLFLCISTNIFFW